MEKNQKQLHINLLKELWSSNAKNKSKLVKEMYKYADYLFPYSVLPNVSEFKITNLQDYHPILLEGEIKKRMGKPDYEKSKGKNGKINRYLEHMFKLLNRYRSSPKRFFKISRLLLHKSISFRLSCIRKINGNWYKNTEFSKMKNLINSYNKLDLRRFKYKRIAIPKPDGSKRWLGVPSQSWRVYQTGLNMILLVYTSIYQHPNQHGFIPGRGTDTAWKDIHSEVLKSKYIYEYDLKKFFDRINLDYLNNILQSTMDMESGLANLIISWSRTMPQNMVTSTE